MVEHMVLVKLKPGVSEAQIDEAIGSLRGLKNAVPNILELSVGRNITPERGQGYNLGLLVRFPNRDALAAYGPHPKHLPVAARLKELAESMVVVDLDV